MNLIKSKIALAATLVFCAAGTAHAKATAEEIAKLGNQLTCVGAEKAGTPAGVAEYSGKWLGAAPGMITEPGKHPIDPYAGEKPLFTITAQNVAQYADKLSDGQKAMFKKFPNTYKMHVYPSHRDFRYDDSICKLIARNAAEAEMSADGFTVPNGLKGGTLFPFPKNGLEAVWNSVFATHASVEYRDTDLAIIYPNGNIQWGAQLTWLYSRNSDPKLRGTKF